MKLDVIVICQNDIGERQRYVGGGQIFFFARGKRHRGAGVDEDVSEQIDFLAEDFNIKPIGARVDAPVEIAQIVARRVAPIVGKFQARAAPRRGVAAGLTAEKFLSRA